MARGAMPAPMSALDQALALLTPADDGYVIDAPEAWAQGRTLYGGMTAALAHHAVTRALGDLPPLRSAQLTFLAPAAGRLRFRPELLRRGRSSAIVAADCMNEAGLALRATFSFAAARDSVVAHERVAAPAVPPPEACRPFRNGAATDFRRGFLERFDFRQASGGRLLAGDGAPEFAVWVRLADGDAADPVTSLLALADALPPPAMVVFPKPAAISSLSWSVDLHRQPEAGGGWRLLTTLSESAAGGYSLQAMRLFDASGVAIASGRQIVAIFV